MNARQFLRAQTRAGHERVDALFSRLDLGRPEDYCIFLQAQAEPHLAAEAALDTQGMEVILADWPRRRRADALRSDLARLGVDAPGIGAPLHLEGEAEMLGAVYVLEGSRLGGAVLKRQLPSDAPRGFLDADQEPGAWRKLLEKLDERLYDQPRLEAAARAAEQLFARFEAAASRLIRAG